MLLAPVTPHSASCVEEDIDLCSSCVDTVERNQGALKGDGLSHGWEVEVSGE